MYPQQIPKAWGRKLVYGCAVPAWRFRVLDASKQPVAGPDVEFVMKRTPTDTHVLQCWTTADNSLKLDGDIITFLGNVNVKVKDVVMGGWFTLSPGGDKLPIEFAHFQIIVNPTP